MAGIDDLLGLGAPGGNVFNIVQGDGSAVPQTPVQQAPQFQHPHGIRNLLGIIGDALLVAHGKDPAYQNGLDQQQQSTALQGFLGDPDAAIQRLMQIPGQQGNAISLWKAAHPPSEKTMEQKVYEYEQGLPAEQRPAFERSISLTHPGMMAPYTMGPGDTLQMPGSQGSTATMPTVATPDEAAKLPPGTRFRLPDRRIGTVPGGQTPPASGNFPMNNPGALRVPGSTQFQSFTTPEQGIHAQEALLGRYMGRGLNNVSSIVETYAPRRSRGGDNSDASVNNYIGYVSRRLNVNPQDALSPAMLPQLGQAMREFETGQRAN